MHVFLHRKSSSSPHASAVCVNDLLGLNRRLSHSKRGSVLTSPHDGALELGNSDLWRCSRNWPSSDKPHQIAFLIYSCPLLPLYPLSILPIPLKVSSPCCRTGVAEQSSCDAARPPSVTHGPWLPSRCLAPLSHRPPRLLRRPLSSNHISNTLMIANTFRKQAQGLEEKESHQIKETLSSQMLFRSEKKLNSVNILRPCILLYARQEASSVLKGQEASHEC